MTQKDNICSGSQEYISILHLDRLRITLKHLDTSTFKNYYNPDIIPEEQIYGKIRLLLDNTRGAGAYYHTFLVFYQGIRVGKLHTANKRRKPDLEFDFDKQTLYVVDETWWHQILETIKAELGLGYNNINYAEIALDTTKNLIKEFRSNFSDTESNKAGVNSYFKLRKGTKVDVLDNGTTFNVRGSCNMVSVYEKTLYAEQYIKDFFKLNGFGDNAVYRVEARLNWDYLKSKMHYKKVLINAETLLDKKMLATLFKMSVENKLVFSDLRKRYYDNNRNIKFEKTSVLNGIKLESAGLLKYNPSEQLTHYKSGTSDKQILRISYYQFIETGNDIYFKTIRHFAAKQRMNDTQVSELLQQFTKRYKGDRTDDVLQRMEYVIRSYRCAPKKWILTVFLNRLGFKFG